MPYGTPMQLKIETLREHIQGGRRVEAIKFAAKFPRLGAGRNAILSAKDAIQNPDFYRQLKKDPEAVIQAGWQALLLQYSPRP